MTETERDGSGSGLVPEKRFLAVLVPLSVPLKKRFPTVPVSGSGSLRVLSATFILSKNSRVLDAKSRLKSANLG